MTSGARHRGGLRREDRGAVCDSHGGAASGHLDGVRLARGGSMSDRLWILEASDPEMATIEQASAIEQRRIR